jgi:gamma-aminobutyrate permease
VAVIAAAAEAKHLLTQTPGVPSRPMTPTPAAPDHALGQTLRARHVTMITVGGIIGAGLFVGSSAAIAAIGPACVVSYTLAGLVILFIMRMLSELAAAAPGTGSFTEFTRLGLGEWAGFTTGWLYWYFWVIVVPIEAIAGAGILHAWLPEIPVWILGFILLTAMTGVNLMSARSFGEFEFWFSSIKVAAIVIFVILAGAYATGLTAPHGNSFANLASHGGFAPKGPLSIIAGVTSVIFAFVGAEIVTIAAAESSEPARAIARLTSSVATRILLFYVVSIFLIVSIVPWDTIRPGVSPFAVALGHVGIGGAATIMNLVVLTAVLSCLNSGIYVTSRVLFGLAAHGDAPSWLVAVNARRVPTRAILAGAAFGYVAIGFSVLSPTVVFSFLVNASGAIALVNYLLVALAQLRLRRNWERTDPSRLVIRMWCFPYLTWAVIAVILAVLAAMAVTPDLRSQFTSSAVVVAIVLALFATLRRRRARAAAVQV